MAPLRVTQKDVLQYRLRISESGTLKGDAKRCPPVLLADKRKWHPLVLLMPETPPAKDPAGGLARRVFPELDFLVAGSQNDYFTGEHLSDYPDGVPDFRLLKFLAGETWQQDVLLIEFSEGWDWSKARIWEYV